LLASVDNKNNDEIVLSKSFIPRTILRSKPNGTEGGTFRVRNEQQKKI
jgi:hypothetical protein